MLINRAGEVDSHTGSVRARHTVRTISTVSAGISLLSKHFKINIYYDSKWVEGHTSKYSMTRLNSADTGEKLRLLHGMEYALQTAGHKAMIDVAYHKNLADAEVEPQKVTVYLCKSIRTKGLNASDIYGLTDAGNNMWLAAFSTRKRDSFYSSLYNIMVHEVFHLFYFQSSDFVQDRTRGQLNAGTLRTTYNGDIKYYGSGYGGTNDSEGVYDGTEDGATTARFLTKYSKLDNLEDISETLSILAIQPQARRFMASDTYIYRKALYISDVFGAEYSCIDAWRPYRWLRYAG